MSTLMDDTFETTWEHEYRIYRNVFNLNNKSTPRYADLLFRVKEIPTTATHMMLVESYPNTFASVMGFAR